jgi:threonine dehydratase
MTGEEEIERKACILVEDELDAAARELRGVSIHTPILRSTELDIIAGRPVLLKAETLQRTGSFKFRGAYNRLRRANRSGGDADVVAYSSGNHALAVAEACRLLNLRPVLLLPQDAPDAKVGPLVASGAVLRRYDRWREDREQLARSIAVKLGAEVIPSSNDPLVMAGQATVSLELVQQAQKLGVRLGSIVVPAGGGGLLAGSAIAVATCGIAMFGMHHVHFRGLSEALGYDSIPKSSPVQPTTNFCDGLAVIRPAPIAVSIIRNTACTLASVTDEEVIAAMRFCMLHLHLTVEPSGAAALAGILFGKVALPDGATGVVLSGSNVTPAAIIRVLTDRPGAQP